MFEETLKKLAGAAATKAGLAQKSVAKYLIASLLAGLYVGLGIFLIMSVGGAAGELGPVKKILMGASFGVALSLVVMAGSELFTGNNLIMTAGLCAKSARGGDVGKVWILSYLGNLIGSILVGALFVGAGLGKGETGQFLLGVAAGKIAAPAMALFFKGVLCNILVCLAVLCAVRMQSESGKLIMIFWCLFAFITSGYEHSIANMSIFTAAILTGGDGISIAGAWYNLLWVTLGNMVGGCGLGIFYGYLGGGKKE